MNARELLTFITPHKPVGWDDAQWLCIVKAAKLLAAAESNDGTTPETDALAKLCSTQFQIAEIARSFERERTGLAARVAELERVSAYAAHLTGEVERALSDDGLCGREIDEVLCNALAERPAGFVAARSKP